MGPLHDDVFLLLTPEFTSFLLSYLNLVKSRWGLSNKSLEDSGSNCKMTLPCKWTIRRRHTDSLFSRENPLIRVFVSNCTCYTFSVGHPWKRKRKSFNQKKRLWNFPRKRRKTRSEPRGKQTWAWTSVNSFTSKHYDEYTARHCFSQGMYNYD